MHEWQQEIKIQFENKHFTILAGVPVTENLSRLFWGLNVT